MTRPTPAEVRGRKLTKAQRGVLEVVGRIGSFSFASGYKPAEALAEMGLVDIYRGSFGLCELRPLGTLIAAPQEDKTDE